MEPRTTDQMKQLRRHAGKWLRSRRQQAGLTQKDLAKALGLEYYTFISQIESGHGRVPSHLFSNWAASLNIPKADFALKMLEFYDPFVFDALGHESAEPLVGEILGGTPV